MKSSAKNLVLAAMFLALAMVLPFLVMQLPTLGQMLLPMHYAAFLAGFVCSPGYAAAVGFIAPLLRSALFGMPPMFPTALAMAFELCTYALVTSLVFRRKKTHSMGTIYVTLLSAMLAGRLVWGIVMAVLMGLSGNAFTFQAFLAGAFTSALPGIIIQLILIPLIVRALQAGHLLH